MMLVARGETAWIRLCVTLLGYVWLNVDLEFAAVFFFVVMGTSLQNLVCQMSIKEKGPRWK